MQMNIKNVPKYIHVSIRYISVLEYQILKYFKIKNSIRNYKYQLLMDDWTSILVCTKLEIISNI